MPAQACAVGLRVLIFHVKVCSRMSCTPPNPPFLFPSSPPPCRGCRSKVIDWSITVAGAGVHPMICLGMLQDVSPANVLKKICNILV